MQLMEDLGEALSRNPGMLFLGGGNPAQIPEAQICFRTHLQELAHDPQAVAGLLGVYPAPQGNDTTLVAVAGYLSDDCGWPVGARNLALVNGSQLAFFILFNLFAGPGSDGTLRQVLLPLVPEYLGYGAQGLHADFFRSHKPQIRLTSEHRFKYSVNFAALNLEGDIGNSENDIGNLGNDIGSLENDIGNLNSNIGAVCISRPTNPTGNLLSDAEVQHLLQLTRRAGIPLLVDLAYGTPFPGLVYGDCDTRWQPGMVCVMSLSKLGLPGVRTAVVVADEEIIQYVTRANTIMSLANGNLGPALLERLIGSGDLQRLSQQTLPQFYCQRRDFLLQQLDRELVGLPYRIHEPEGAFFLWLWLEGLPVPTQTLYQSLKDQGVLIMAGEAFFFGWDAHWQHARECVRLTYCQPEAVLEKAVKIIARELRRLYAGRG